MSKAFTPPPALWAVKGGGVKRYTWPLFGLESVPEVSEAQRAIAARIFASGARYLGDQHAVLSPTAQRQEWVEIAVLGRSNVGKSSLLNALLGSRDNKFVPVSRHPGKTASVEFYGVGSTLPPPLVLVDTPGYGFSVRGRSRTEDWMSDISEYIMSRDRGVLARVAVLVDARVGFGDLDVELLRRLEGENVPVQIVATKVDAVSQGQLEALALRAATLLTNFVMPFPVLNAVSAKTGEGMKELQRTLVQTAKLHRRMK